MIDTQLLNEKSGGAGTKEKQKTGPAKSNVGC